MSVKWILTPEDYKAYVASHPEEIVPEDEWEIYGVKFIKAKPITKPNRTERRARKRKKP